MAAIQLGDVDYALFERELGHSFRLEREGASVDFTLAAARQLGTAMLPDARAPFALVFIGPPSPRLAQGLYRLRARDGHVLEVVLVPGASSAHGIEYQAVFS